MAYHPSAFCDRRRRVAAFFVSIGRALWFTNENNNSIGRITTGGVVTNYTGTGIGEPDGITAGPDGALWFTNPSNGTIGRITTGGVVTNYTGTGISDPFGITAGPDGALWFTNFGNASVGRITTGGVVTNYTGTGISAPDGITAGPDGALWFTNANNDSIGRITTGANPSPTTSVLIPSNGATLSGSTYLDASASNATSVEFRLFGGSYGYAAPVVCTATLTYYGWLCSWNTTTVPNGSYYLLSEAFNSGGSTFSSGVSITVNNPPTTSVLIPSNGATLSGSTYLDASASNATSVEFRLFGGSYGYNAPVICTATLTLYGWLCSWNTTTVPNGSYYLLSEAFNSGGSTFSPGVGITVNNAVNKALWFTNFGNNSIGRITTAGVITIYSATGIASPGGITAGPDGALWFTNSNANSIDRITASGTVTSYTGTGIDEPKGITTGPDGALWFTNVTSNSIGRITTAGVVTSYTGTGTGIDEPEGITAGPDGALWFTNFGGSSIGRITTSGTVTNYTGTGIDEPEGITAGPDGALWFTNSGSDTIGRITTSGTVTSYASTGILSSPESITAGP
jgi:streptogramin lyase